MSIRDVGLITYHCPHLKTEQVLQRLLHRGYRLSFYALQFKSRAARSPAFQHRPDQSQAVAPSVLATRHGIPYTVCAADTDIPASAEIYLILGAGILSSECVANKKVVNCHPGIIPASRGLDSFKWAIFEQKPLGITLHYIDQHVDQGEIIAVQPTEVYSTDTLATLARRHYENEIDVLSRFEEFIAQPQNPFAGIDVGAARMRMPRDAEADMLARFHDYTTRYGQPTIDAPASRSENSSR